MVAREHLSQESIKCGCIIFAKKKWMPLLLVNNLPGDHLPPQSNVCFLCVNFFLHFFQFSLSASSHNSCTITFTHVHLMHHLSPSRCLQVTMKKKRRQQKKKNKKIIATCLQNNIVSPSVSFHLLLHIYNAHSLMQEMFVASSRE